MYKKLLKLIASIIICQSAGVFGSLFTFEAVPGWYITLEKPFFAPPNWIFAPVWIILYFLMGVSLYIVWEDELKSKIKNVFFVLFGIQLILNTLWSFLFFGLKSPLLGLVDILILDVLVVVTIFYAKRVSKFSAILLIPYMVWIIIASVLNYAILVLN
jgi:tryptophan-rich sensory protein